jgi:DtxR family Mn-dependent transcriptional regulator
MLLTKALRKYLRVIYELECERGPVRVSEIAERMRVKAPSVTAALRKLYSCGLVSYRRYEKVSTNKKGRDVVENLQARHGIIKEFFVLVGLDEETADKDAHEMNHVVGTRTIRKLREFVQSYQTHGE